MNINHVVTQQNDGNAPILILSIAERFTLSVNERRAMNTGVEITEL